MEWRDYQVAFIEWSKSASKENRISLIKTLLSNVTLRGIKDIQNIAARIIKKKKYSDEPTTENVEADENYWWELPDATRLTNWAGYTREDFLIGYLKALLPVCRKNEVQEIRSSWTYHAREAILYPERLVSRRQSVPSQVGWWSPYTERQGCIISVDCEMVSIKIGVKPNGDNRCKNVAATVSVFTSDGIKEPEAVYKATIKHNPKDVYLTPKMRKITGFNERSIINGIELTEVQKQLNDIFRGKLLILIGAGSDFKALEMAKGNYHVFDLHTHYSNDKGKIGLRSLVKHFYGIDIHAGVHDPDIDAKYTLKIFYEHYIPDKLQHPDECNLETTERVFNNIQTLK